MAKKKSKKIKGLILAGGSGKRLSPLTSVLNKHLINVYDKPMIYYPLSILMLTGSKDIAIVCNQEDKEKFSKLLGDGSKLGIKLKYLIQDKPDGICGGIKIAKNYIGKNPIFLILGDNFFYGNTLIEKIKTEIKILKHCTIFSHSVNDHKNYGIIEYDKKKQIKKIHEKPVKKFSGTAVTGMYLFDNTIIDKIDKVTPSKRNELEITDLINQYIGNKIREVRLARGVTWFDTGSFDDLLSASNFIKIVEKKQAQKIGCIEESAYDAKLIDKKKFEDLIKDTVNTDLKYYLKAILSGRFDQ